jgi:thioredoxin reductase
MSKVYDVIIIGAGPAGISTAIQLKRYGFNFLLLEKESIGGLLKNASLVENYPGFPKGIKGLKLINLFKKHLSELRIGIRNEKVLSADYKKKLFFIRTNRNNYTSRFLVVASGTKPKILSENISPRVRVYYEVHELSDVRNKDIAIIGGGDAAFDYAVSLSERNNNISIIHRSGEPVCIPILLKKVLLKKNISYFCKLKAKKIYKEKSKIKIECSNRKVFYADYLVAAIGREPQLSFLKNIKEFKKSAGDSLYYTGDVKNDIYRQVSISIGDGIRTAMEISKKIKKDDENKS